MVSERQNNIDYAELEIKRRNALFSRDAWEYAILCGELGVEPEDSQLVELGLLEQTLEDERIEKIEKELSEKSPKTKKIEKPPLRWRIRQKDIECMPYTGLQNLFIGMNNLTIPFLIMAVMNPDEIAAKWYSAGKIKQRNEHKTHTRDFYSIIRILDDFAYSDRYFQRFNKSCRQMKLRYNSKPGEQKERLSKISFDQKKMFIDSFFADYRFSDREKPEHEADYHDPNYDGYSSRLYVQAIWIDISRMWLKAYSDS